MGSGVLRDMRRVFGTKIDVLQGDRLPITYPPAHMERMLGHFQYDRFLPNESRIVSRLVQTRLATYDMRIELHRGRRILFLDPSVHFL